MDLISVIVPVYKVENYLDKCVQSIVDQTYRNLEIILVDDGSPDRCGAMCDAWAEKDSRIKVIHKENGGVSSARNMGMAAAAGTYVCFIDSDDQVDPQFAQLLYEAAINHQADVAACKMLCVHGEAPPPLYGGTPNIRVCTTEDIMKDLICGGDYQGGPCDKLYRKDLLCDVEFPVGYRHEDEFFTHRAALKAKRFVIMDAPLYVYYQWDNSFMHSFSAERLDALEAALERLVLIQDRYPELYRKGKAAFCISCIANCRAALNVPRPDQDSFISVIRTYRRRIRFTFGDIIHYQPKEAIYIVASRFCPVSFSKLLNLRKRVDQ